MSDGDGRNDTSLTRHEERLVVGRETVEHGRLRIGTTVESEPVSSAVPRQVEHFEEVERAAPGEADSGEVETLADGSISIPILEEELVITKRVIVRERVVVRKRTTTEEQVVEAELRRERIAVEGDVVDDDHRASDTP